MNSSKYKEINQVLSRLESLEAESLKKCINKFPYMHHFRQWYTLKTDEDIALAILYSPNPRQFQNQLGEFRWYRKRRPTPLPSSGMEGWKARNRKLAAHPDTRVVDESAQTVNDLAEVSIVENKSIVSETLAILLERQEQYEKAIQMYERLILKFPEKSSYFADKIEIIKSKVQ